MFKDISAPSSSEKIQAQIKEQFRRDVLREDERTRANSRSSSARARKALEMITETLQDYRAVIKTEEVSQMVF